MRGSLATMVDPQEGTGPSFEEDLAYLLLFSEALLDMIPDGVAVLDDRLRVRSANHAFLRQLGLGTLESARGARLGDEPLLRAGVRERGDRSLAGVLGSIFESDVGLVLDRLEVPVPDGAPEAWAVRAAPWDTEHPTFRRILLCVRRIDRSDSATKTAVPAPGRATRPFTVLGWTKEVLELLPAGVCVLDPSHQVRALNAWLERAFGRQIRPEDSADRHVFALLPELRSSELTDLLDDARQQPDWVAATIPVELASGRQTRFGVQARAFVAGDGEVSEILLVLRTEAPDDETGPREAPRPRPPSAPERGERYAGGEPTGEEAPVEVEDILSPENLDRFPDAPTDRILIVDPDPWTRMVISVSLRQAGFEDLSLAESFSTALASLDPDSFGLIVVGWDRDPEEAGDFCRGAIGIAPRSPLLVVTEQGPAEARALSRGLALLGVLPGPVLSDDLRRVVAAALRRSQESPPVRRPPRTLRVVILGAGQDEVSVLRLLYRVQRIDVRMVWDPDPAAFGILLAKNLGIPTIAGDLSMELGERPDAVVLARAGLEPELARLGLAGCPRVTREELELFLVDPESFVETERDPGASHRPLADPPPPIPAAD
ncbi:MAG: PAS domain-containing protein, partial [bacterium]